MSKFKDTREELLYYGTVLAENEYGKEASMELRLNYALDIAALRIDGLSSNDLEVRDLVRNLYKEKGAK